MRLILSLAAAAVLSLGGAGSAGAASPARPLAPAGAPGRLFPRPDRPVAAIVTDLWGDEGQRDLAGETRQLVARLGVRPGMVVADIGAGAGYDTLRLARVVGPSGQVIAQDIRPEYLAGLKRAVEAQKLGNVTLALGQTDDPRLRPGSVDVAILVHMYHEIAAPYAFLYNFAPALKPGGRVGVVDSPRATNQHGTPPALLKCEFEAVGYRQISTSEMQGQLGYLAVFEAPAAAARPAPATIRPCKAPRGS